MQDCSDLGNRYRVSCVGGVLKKCFLLTELTSCLSEKCISIENWYRLPQLTLKEVRANLEKCTCQSNLPNSDSPVIIVEDKKLVAGEAHATNQ